MISLYIFSHFCFKFLRTTNYVASFIWVSCEALVLEHGSQLDVASLCTHHILAPLLDVVLVGKGLHLNHSILKILHSIVKILLQPLVKVDL